MSPKKPRPAQGKRPTPRRKPKAPRRPLVRSGVTSSWQLTLGCPLNPWSPLRAP